MVLICQLLTTMVDYNLFSLLIQWVYRKGVESMNNDKQILVEMGLRIAKRRKELHLTQEQLAERVNMSLQSISCIELGKKAIRPENLIFVCKALAVSADYLLTGTKTAEQLAGIDKKLAALDDGDLALVFNIVDRLLSSDFK